MKYQRTPITNRHDAYQDRANDIAKLISVIQMELGQRDEETHTWSDVGDMSKVRSDLIDIAEFISGFNRGEIEEFLMV